MVVYQRIINMRLFLLKETGNHIEQYQIVFDIVENFAKLSPTSRDVSLPSFQIRGTKAHLQHGQCRCVCCVGLLGSIPITSLHQLVYQAWIPGLVTPVIIHHITKNHLN
jgi:hypothetical protein